MTKALKIVLPLVVVAVALLIAVSMYLARPEPETRIPEPPRPLIRVQSVVLASRQLTVLSQGTVRPRTESDLVAEVAGTVVEVSPSFVVGGFFEAGEVLLRVDPLDYEQALIQARSLVSQAELRLAQQEAEAELARREWSELGSGAPSPLTLREPQVAEARAALEAARATVIRTERDLERTRIRATFAGRVREKKVDLGQFVGRGAPVGKLYAVDFAEIMLPLPDAEMAFLDLPLGYRGDTNRSEGPEVLLSATFAGQRHRWQGTIVRTGGEIDSKSRMIQAVARVADPYGKGPDPDRPPLTVGMFVEAEILGIEVDDVAVVPRSALRDERFVIVVDDEDRLHKREVDLLRTNRQEAVIRAGLAHGDRVCLTALEAFTEGMRVRVLDDTGDGTDVVTEASDRDGR